LAAEWSAVNPCVFFCVASVASVPSNFLTFAASPAATAVKRSSSGAATNRTGSCATSAESARTMGSDARIFMGRACAGWGIPYPTDQPELTRNSGISVPTAPTPAPSRKLPGRHWFGGEDAVVRGDRPRAESLGHPPVRRAAIAVAVSRPGHLLQP